MRRHAFFVVVSAMALTVMLVSPAGGVAGFGDVDSDQFFTEPVQWMVDNGITTGTSPTCFSPGDPVTRGQSAAFMWRMEGSVTGAPSHSFSDVVAVWQQDPVSWMVQQGITTGTSPTTFSPENPVTRGDLAALLHRLAGEPDAPPPVQFPDVVKPWQVTPVGWMVQEGITTGTSSTTFSPDATVTRGQIATFFYRYQGSPSVVVDPNHPAMPPCEDQVAGPATSGTVTIITDTTLIQSHNGQIIIDADNITLDCAGHSVTGNGVGVGIELGGRTGVTVRNCDVSGFQNGIVLNGSNGNTIEQNNVHDNVVTGEYSLGIGLRGSSDNTISNNVVTNNCDPTVDAQAGIGLFEANSNTVIGNTVTGNGSRGIGLWIADHNVVNGNEVRANGDHGLAIGRSNFNRIEGNQVIGNGTSELWGDGSGIRLGEAASNEVINNHFDENVIGISPFIAVVSNTFTGNTANNNALWGIEDHSTGGTGDAGTDNTYSNNTCSGNGEGPSSPLGLCFG